MTDRGMFHDGHVQHSGECVTEREVWSRRSDTDPPCFRVFMEDTVHPNVSSSGSGVGPGCLEGTWEGDTSETCKQGQSFQSCVKESVRCGSKGQQLQGVKKQGRLY